MIRFIAFAALAASLGSEASARAPSLADQRWFEAGPDMGAEEILQACVAFAETASGDGTDLYQGAHSNYRYCLMDLRRAAAPELDPVIGEALTALLPAADPVVQMHTFLELGRIEYRPAAPLMAEALASEDWRVAVSAARALGAVGDETHQPALRQAMSESLEQPALVAENTYLVLGGTFPFDAESARWLEEMSASERRDYLRYLEDRRDYLRDQYAELDDPERATVFWAGDRNAFGQPMGGGMDPETREFVDACPGQVFIDAAGETVDLTREPPLDEGVMAPSADYALAMPGGGRLVGERDTNPQWLGAGPAALRWVGEGGRGGACLRTAAKLHHRS